MSEAAGEAPPAGRASILVVDDRRENLIAMEALLGSLGREIVTAESGEDALRRLLADDFAVILLDVQMPGMDGFETARYIRDRPRSRHVPIIFVTAVSTETDHVFAGYQAGAVDYLLKPVNPDVLRSKVSVFLELYEANQRLRRQAELRAVHDSLALAQRSGMSGVWDWDIAAGRIFFSPEYEDLCGMGPTPPERVGAWLDVVHPAERERLSRRLERLLESGEEWDEEYRIVHVERGIRWLSARGRVYRGAAGAPERFTGIAFDVTERKLVEARTGRLHEATAALSAAASSAEVVALVLEHAPVATGARSATLWFPDDRPPAGAPLPAAAGAQARRAVLEGKPVVSADGGRRVLMTLACGDAVQGVLFLDYGRPAPPDEEARSFLLGFGAQCAQALERARLYDAERRARDRARFGADVSLTLDAAGLGVQSRLERLAELLVPRLADACTIELEVDGEISTVSVRAVSTEVEDALSAVRNRHPREEHEGGVIDEVIRTGQSRLLDDPSLLADQIGGPGAPPPLVARLRRHAPTCAVIVPIAAHGRAVGAIMLLSLDPARRFDQDDVQMASDVGRRAGLALENARLFEEQAGVALTLQRSLLPRELPSVQGMTWAGRYISKAAGTEAGGDWFAAVVLDETRVALAVGDVVGRGTEAAAVMGQLRGAMRAYAMAGMSPADILTHLSRLAEGIPGAFASTAACVEIDHAAGRLRYARAGHPPPLLIAPGGEARFLDMPAGAILGVRHDEHGEVSAEIPDGAAILLYTDGAIERRGEPLDTGLERLARTAVLSWPSAPSVLCDELVARLFLDDAPDDDVALLVARVGVPGPLSLRAPAEPDQLSTVRRGLREWLRTVPMAQPAREDVVLACGEALSNAVEHGASGRTGVMMSVDAEWDAGGVVRVTVRDDGGWREASSPPEGLRGRGLALIRRIMDDVHVAAREDHTEVTMSLRPDPPSTVVVGSASESAVLTTTSPGPAQVEVLHLDGLRLVRLGGEIDAASAVRLLSELDALVLAQGPLTIDMSGVDYLDSAGVALIWAIAATLERRGDELQLIVPQGCRTRRVLELSGPQSIALLEETLVEDSP